jgi:phytoene dehydrogenase-like protein
LEQRYDAIVLGSGVGGSCAAALLANEGCKVLLAEKRAYLGGRFSTSDHDGYLCATGGLAVQVGGPRSRRSVHRSASRRVSGALNDALNWLEPSDALSFRDWLNQYTANPRIHGLFQSTIASLLTVNSWELPAAEYFKLVRNIAPLRFGYVEGGSLRLWERMADFWSRGGEVVTRCAAMAIGSSSSRVTGATWWMNGRDLHVQRLLSSATRPPRRRRSLAATLRAELPARRPDVRPTAILWLHFVSDEPVLNYSAVAVCGSRRVNMVDAPSYDCPDVAPPGKHLYTVGAAPLDALAPGDIDAEFKQVLDDLRDIIPGFDTRCRVLTRTCYRGKWPGFRSVPGSPVPHRTPVKGLFNVGDASYPRGFAGSMGAATSAVLVWDDLRTAV